MDDRPDVGLMKVRSRVDSASSDLGSVVCEGDCRSWRLGQTYSMIL